MEKLALISLMCISVTVGSVLSDRAAGGQSKSDQAPVSTLRLDGEGEYLVKEFVDSLSQRNSVRAAIESSQRERGCKVYKRNEDEFVFFFFDFDSADGTAIFDSSGHLVRTSEFAPSVTLQIIDHETFSIRIGDRLRIYRFVGSTEKFIGKHTIVGRFTDENGRPYLFTEDGIAVWPGVTFRYVIDTTLEFSDRDRIFQLGSEDPADTIGFEVKDHKLYMWRNSNKDAALPVHTEFADPPFLVLNRTEGKGKR